MKIFLGLFILALAPFIVVAWGRDDDDEDPEPGKIKCFHCTFDISSGKPYPASAKDCNCLESPHNHGRDCFSISKKMHEEIIASEKVVEKDVCAVIYYKDVEDDSLWFERSVKSQLVSNLTLGCKDNYEDGKYHVMEACFCDTDYCNDHSYHEMKVNSGHHFGHHTFLRTAATSPFLLFFGDFLLFRS